MTEAPLNGLFRRISPLGNPSISVVPVLDQWVAEGNPIDENELHFCIRRLRFHNRYSQALEISFWMTDKRYFPLTASDVAIRLDLISKAHGIEQAENFFNNSVPNQLKGFKVYSAFLRCYVRIKSVKKAEALMQRMRDLGLLRYNLPFNSMLTLYYNTGNYKKLDTLMQEMEERDIAGDSCTYSICLSAYATQCNVDGIDKILEKVGSVSTLTPSWDFYSVATDAYMKVGHMDKALAMLKKSEALMLIGGESGTLAYNCLLTQYAKLGKKEEVLRLWDLYKTNMIVYNKGYMFIINSLLKLDDIETAEKIFYEWESQVPVTLEYNIRVPNILLGAYSRKVNAMKEALLISKPGWKPSDESLAACLKYLKGKGDVDEAAKFINLPGDKDIISAEVQVKFLSYVKDGNVDSTLDGLLMLDGDALHESR
ncbi:hypothetical protein CCACVL1_29516 [Corchorus capsularis]|uniref:Pentatricopeptide repeat-containing protein n=1 Tax=Corchorus capsularis TaxID=210143 RepID=A0A1R3G1F8_COCAP|nr:hypothetical protein CCACVL1_29516 [Corchorus capsularis]